MNKNLELIKFFLKENIAVQQVYKQYLELKDKFYPETDEHILEYCRETEMNDKDSEIIKSDIKNLKELESIFETKFINLLE